MSRFDNFSSIFDFFAKIVRISWNFHHVNLVTKTRYLRMKVITQFFMNLHAFKHWLILAVLDIFQIKLTPSRWRDLMQHISINQWDFENLIGLELTPRERRKAGPFLQSNKIVFSTPFCNFGQTVWKTKAPDPSILSSLHPTGA